MCRKEFVKKDGYGVRNYRIPEKLQGFYGFTSADLPRIFFYSGARSVISTLWRIEDKSTARFMKYFYKYLTKGFDKSESLRLAKIKMIKSGYSHPFFWAGFVLNGEYSSAIF